VPPLRADNWPEAWGLIDTGKVRLTFVNRAPFELGVGLRQGAAGRDFVVPPGGRRLLTVPPGSYEVYYRLYNQPGSLFHATEPLAAHDALTITYTPGSGRAAGRGENQGVEKLN
jgi:hypothetical protein